MATSHIESLSQISDNYFWWRGRFEWVVESLKGFPAKTYIDIGCGDGFFAKKLNSTLHFSRVGLIDGEKTLLDKVKDFSKAELFLKDLSKPLELPFVPDLISMMDVLEHLKDDEAFLKNLYQAMRHGSRLVVSVPALPYAFSEWDKQLGHFRRYYKSELDKKLKAAGFKTVSITYAWSFLVPSAISRRFKTKRYQQNMEFEKIPNWLNTLLFSMFKVERFFSPPIGTSVFAIGEK